MEFACLCIERRFGNILFRDTTFELTNTAATGLQSIAVICYVLLRRGVGLKRTPVIGPPTRLADIKIVVVLVIARTVAVEEQLQLSPFWQPSS